MISILISVLLACLIFGLILWVITLFPIPEPFHKIAQAIIVILFAVYLISLLLPYASHPGVLR